MSGENWDGEDRRENDLPFDHEERRQVDETAEKEFPKISLKTIGVVLGIVVSIGSLIGGIIAIDDRYMTHTEHKEVIETLKKEFLEAQEVLAKGGKRLFIMSYEDQLDDINFKIQNGTATEFEKAKKIRIERRIEAIRRGDF